MKATGIVRRIDDLGRIVLPMEIRRIFKIRDGDSIEIFCTDDGHIMLKKYSLINENVNVANEIAKAISTSLNASVAVFDTDKVLSVSELSKKEYINTPISKELSELFNKHKPVFAGNYKDESGKYLFIEKPVKIIDGSFDEFSSQIIIPVLNNSDYVGGIIVCSKTSSETTLTPNDIKTVIVSGQILSNLT